MAVIQKIVYILFTIIVEHFCYTQKQNMVETDDNLQCIVQYTGEVSPPVPGVITWSQLLEIGRAETDQQLTHRLEQQAVNMACMLVYTSGTTG